MSKKSPDNNAIELSSLDFGPAWARKNDSPKKEYRSYDGEKKGRPARGGGAKGGRPARSGNQRDDQQGRTPRKNFKGRSQQRYTPVVAEAGIEASIMPVEAGVDNLAKEIAAAGRTYSVFELARVVLGARERFHIIFKKKSKEENDGVEGPDLYQCKLDNAVFLTKEECLSHAAGAKWLETLYKSEVVEVEAPSGNFQAIAKCGYSGELLGPTNFHGYQERVQELHRTSFSNMSLDQYKSKIVTESGEEIVNLWKESMKQSKIYKLVSDEKQVFESRALMLQHFANEGFKEVFHHTHKVHVPSEIEAKYLSPSLLANLKEVIQDQRRYPGALSSFLCRQLSGRHLAVYKWQGKLHCGPSRPHAIPEDLKIAERPAKINDWVKANEGAGIDELWKSVWPEKLEDSEKHEWYRDLHWLINEGYVVLMNSGHLFPSTASKKAPKKNAKKQGKAPQNKKPEDSNKKKAPVKKDAAKAENPVKEEKAAKEADSADPKPISEKKSDESTK